jgi:inner membrane protein
LKRVTHIFFALALTAVLNLWFLDQGVLYTFTVIVFSIAPDLDLGRYHRKLLHNIFMLLPLIIISQLVSTYLGLRGHYLALSVITGWLSHVFLDSLTKKGVALLYPFSGKLYGLKLFNSDSLVVNALFIATSLLVVTYRIVTFIA